MDARGSPDRPRATTAHGGRAGDDSAKDDPRRAVRTVTTATVLIGGPLFPLDVLLTRPPHKEGAPVTRDHDVRLADGRVLRVRDTGATNGDAVFLLHEPLGSRLVVDGLSATATDTGLRLMSYDRPGYGGSTPKLGRGVADAAAEVAAIADEFGVDRFAVWASRAAARSRLPVPCCWPTAWSPPQWSLRWRPTTRPDWTGLRA